MKNFMKFFLVILLAEYAFCCKSLYLKDDLLLGPGLGIPHPRLLPGLFVNVLCPDKDSLIIKVNSKGLRTFFLLTEDSAGNREIDSGYCSYGPDDSHGYTDGTTLLRFTVLTKSEEHWRSIVRIEDDKLIIDTLEGGLGAELNSKGIPYKFVKKID